MKGFDWRQMGATSEGRGAGMTDQELYQERELSSKFRQEAEWVFSVQCMNEDAAIAFAKAYADARVATKDTEITQLKAELKWANEQLAGIKTDMQHSRLIEAAQVKEVAELKAECDKRGGCIIEMSQERARLDSENKAMKAEIKRLRQGIQKVLDQKQKQNHNPYSPLKALLSPAPVTESRYPISLQMYKCNNCQWRGQVGESIETETCDVCPECKSEDLFLYDEDEDQE